MINLAGFPQANFIIEGELIRCNIDRVYGEEWDGKIRCNLYGLIYHDKLGVFTFVRSLRYWVVHGLVPLEIAEKLYSDPVGLTDIRANGNCNCPEPLKSAAWFDEDGIELLDMSRFQETVELIKNSSSKHVRSTAIDFLTQYRFVDDPQQKGSGYITNYHIDSELGLRLFSDAIRGYS